MRSAFEHFEKVKWTSPLKSFMLEFSKSPCIAFSFWWAQNKYCVTGWQQPFLWCDMGLLDRPHCQLTLLPMELPLGSAPGSAAEGNAQCWFSNTVGLHWPPPLHGLLRCCSRTHTCSCTALCYTRWGQRNPWAAELLQWPTAPKSEKGTPAGIAFSKLGQKHQASPALVWVIKSRTSFSSIQHPKSDSH